MQASNRCVSLGLVAVLLGSGSSLGCELLEGKDQARCDEALATARKSMQDDFLDMSLARQWRDHAGKACGVGPELQTLDKEILDKEAALAKAVVDKANAEREAGQKAIDEITKVWDAYDKLAKDEKDKDELKKQLKKHDKKAKQAIKDGKLTPDYGKQALEYAKDKYDTRKKKLDDK